MAFELQPRIAGVTQPVGDLLLSRVLMMNDARFPWLVLVPRRPGIIEITDLPTAERSILMEEIAAASTALKEATGAHRINVGALGNVVAQLHVHVVARFETDPAWPGAVWGHGKPEPYGDEAAASFRAALTQRLTFV